MCRHRRIIIIKNKTYKVTGGKLIGDSPGIILLEIIFRMFIYLASKMRFCSEQYFYASYFLIRSG